MFGPGVRPELPPNFERRELKVSDSRPVADPSHLCETESSVSLDGGIRFSDMHESFGCRTTTTIAPQALTLLNSELIVNAARQFAGRINHEANTADPVTRIELAWQAAFGRAPNSSQTKAAVEFIAKQQQVIAETDPARTGEDINRVKDGDQDEAFVDLCHALLNANEFLFVE